MLNWPPNFWLLVFLIHSSCYSLTTATQPSFWISEVYNSFYNFTDAFVEIYDGGRGNVTLLDINLEFEKQNSETLSISLHNMTTNYGGFLVLSFENGDEPTKNLLKYIQNETVTLKLTIPGKANDSRIIDAFKKEKGWSDVISCFRNETAINSIVLVGKEPSKGEHNNCPLSPVRLDLLMCRSPFNLTLQLLSHGIDHFSLANHEINFLEDSTLIQTFSLGNYSMQKTKVNISLPINRTFNANSTYTMNLELQIAKEVFVLLESVYFGAQNVSGIPLNHTFKTFPDKNPAQWVSPVYLQLAPSQSTNFASCHCEVSSSTYNPFVKVKSFNLRDENCEKKCNELIMMPSAPDNSGTDKSSLPLRSTASISSTLTATSLSPNGTASSISPNGTVPSVLPEVTASPTTPEGTMSSVSSNEAASFLPTNGTSLATVPPKNGTSSHPNTIYSVVTHEDDSTDLHSHTQMSESLSTVGYSSLGTETTVKSTATIIKNDSSTVGYSSLGTETTVKSMATIIKNDSSTVGYSSLGTERTVKSTATIPTTIKNDSSTVGYSSLGTERTMKSTATIPTTIKNDSSTVGYSSLGTETTVKSTATIKNTTIKNDSTTELKTSTMISNFSESTYQKLVTSTVSITTQMTILPLNISEVKVGLQSVMDHWIELKGIAPFESVSSYYLVLSVAGQAKTTTFSLHKLKTTNKDGILNINSQTPGADQLLKGLNSKAGVLQLFDKNGKHTELADCVAYQMEGTLLETKLINICPLQKVKQITAREVRQNWTISRCGKEFEILEPSAQQNNKCPSLKFSKNVYMKILKRQLTTDFKTYFLSSLVQKLSSEEGCMVSTSFFRKFDAANSGKDLNIHSILAAPDQTKLNALYMCYKNVFNKKPATFHLGSETVSVHRCYNSSYIIPTVKVSPSTMPRKSQIIAFVVASLAVFVCLVGGFLLYLRHKKKSLLSVLGIARYDADQDDLLVNMEDVGRLDTNFRNPTYSQLSAY